MSDTTLDRTCELQLARRWRDDRDGRARTRLTAALQPLVQRLARRYGDDRSRADLVQEGNLGLLQAIDRFDPERGIRLATYAAWWIRAYILRYVEHNDRLVRGTTTKARLRLFYQLNRTRQQLLARGEDPTASAVARELGVDEDDVVAMELLAPPIASLDARVPGHDGDAPARIDRVADDAASPEEWFGENELRNRLDGVLDSFGRTLHGRSLEMFRDRIAASRPVSLRELSRRWGVTPATARRIETRVARPLRRFLFEQMGDSIGANLSSPAVLT